MKLKVQQLTKQDFAPYGTFYNPWDCGMPVTGKWDRNNFMPDRLISKVPTGCLIAINSTQINPGPMIVDRSEWHDMDEVIGGFTEDTVFHVGLPTWNDTPDLSTYRIFYLPKGWWVRKKRGVWHQGPFVLGDSPAVGTVVLPPSAYRWDMVQVTLSDPIEIEL